MPYAGLIADSSGNLYGTTENGGANNLGTVFELSPTSDGSWNQTVLYSFAGGSDGAQPHAGLLFDSAGNLYGTTNLGGSANCSKGCGTVFKLAPGSGSGDWSESVIYAFAAGSDGQQPYARLILDAQGNLYGTTSAGGHASTACALGCGTVFQLAPGSSSWKETLLYTFLGGNDGASPYAGLTFDTAGNLYGTTYAGGARGDGTVFKLTPGSGASWTESVLHSFTGGWDGNGPLADVTFDATGNLYGTTLQGGGQGNFGVVFELQPQTTGAWKEKLLHVFWNRPAAHPMAGLVLDASGNLYGTTALGAPTSACPNGCGTLFKITPSSTGAAGYQILRLFGRNSDGYNPSGDLIFDSKGNLWGTTQAGGSQNAGAVFEVVP